LLRGPKSHEISDEEDMGAYYAALNVGVIGLDNSMFLLKLLSKSFDILSPF
jgi:hypothetical protein